MKILDDHKVGKNLLLVNLLDLYETVTSEPYTVAYIGV